MKPQPTEPQINEAMSVAESQFMAEPTKRADLPRGFIYLRPGFESLFVLQTNLPTYLRAQADGVLLSVKLQPRASKNEIGAALGEELRIKVTAPPVDAAANQALVELLVETLQCSRGQVELIRGHTSRHKVIKLHGLAVETVAKLLVG